MGLGRAGVGLLCLAAAFAGQADLSPELSLLGQIRQKMADNLSRTPNYTCLETIERSGLFERLYVADRIRVEVALVNGKELFTWPGAEKFEETALYDLVGGGTTATGDFAIHARTVFAGRSPIFEYKGEEARRGRPALRYSYLVPRFASNYEIGRAHV